MREVLPWAADRRGASVALKAGHERYIRVRHAARESCRRSVSGKETSRRRAVGLCSSSMRWSIEFVMKSKISLPSNHSRIQPLPSLLKQHAGGATRRSAQGHLALSCLFQAGQSAARLWKRTRQAGGDAPDASGLIEDFVDGMHYEGAVPMPWC